MTEQELQEMEADAQKMIWSTLGSPADDQVLRLVAEVRRLNGLVQDALKRAEVKR